MLKHDSILHKIKNETIKLSKSDKKIATVILDNPNSVIHFSIASLAKLASVSEPTVNRFCRKLGCDGYPNFKLKLAQEISSGGALLSQDTELDNNSLAINKVSVAIEQSIEMLLESLDPKILDQAATRIVNCKSINFFGMGASGLVALDAQHKFFRFGIPAVAHTDYINQRMMCSMLDRKAVAVLISYGGRTTAMVVNAELARQRQATTIGITTKESPLAQHCDYVLNVETLDDIDLSIPTTSRIMHLAVVDILATMVALKMGSSVHDNIKQMKLKLASTRD